MTATMMLPVSRGGFELAKAAPARHPQHGLEVSVRLLAAAGLTAPDLARIRRINPDVLRVLVAKVAPNADVYCDWADLVRNTRMTADLLGALIDAHADAALSLDELTDLVRYAKAHQVPGRLGDWLVAHACAGNRVQDVAPLGTWAPPWLVAWSRTLIAPGDDVPDVVIGEDLVWAYMDTLMRFPNLPEKVVAHTLAKAPYPRYDAETPGEWLRGAWNQPGAGGLTALGL